MVTPFLPATNPSADMTVTYKINGETVTRAEFNQNPRGAGQVRMPYSPSQVIVSEGAAVHPKDRKSAEEHARKHGFAIDFDDQGRPSFTSHRQQRAYLRKIGMHNRDAYLS